MIALDEETARLLAEARQAFTPERRQAERVHAAVLAAVAVPEQLGEAATSGPNGASAAAARFSARAGARCLGREGVVHRGSLAIGAASGAGIWAFGASESPPRAVEQSKPRVEPKPVSPSPNDAVPSAVSAVASAEHHHQTATASGRATPPPVAAESGVPELALRDELKGVREAERALNAGEPRAGTRGTRRASAFPRREPSGRARRAACARELPARYDNVRRPRAPVLEHLLQEFLRSTNSRRV